MANVLGVAELLEMNLLELPMKDLVLAQRIYHFWNAVINGSESIRWALFFESGAAADATHDAPLVRSDRHYYPGNRCVNRNAQHVSEPASYSNTTYYSDFTDDSVYDSVYDSTDGESSQRKCRTSSSAADDYRATESSAYQRYILRSTFAPNRARIQEAAGLADKDVVS